MEYFNIEVETIYDTWNISIYDTMYKDRKYVLNLFVVVLF